MATVHTGKMTAEEFWDWCQRPENADRRVELDRGEIVDLPLTGMQHGVVCSWVAYLLGEHVLQHGGQIAINNTGLVIQEDPGTVRGPDLILFGESLPWEQLRPEHSRRLPQLVVEVLSPSDKTTYVIRCVADYLRRGIPLVWLVDPSDRTVSVHRPGELPVTLDQGDELTGDGVLVDFRLPVAKLFKLPGTAATDTPIHPSS